MYCLSTFLLWGVNVLKILSGQRSQEIVLAVFLATPFRECMEGSFWYFYILVDKHLSFVGIFNFFIQFRGMDGC